MKLATQNCIPCHGGESPVSAAEMKALLHQLPGWQLTEVAGVNRLERVFNFNNFAEALDFTNRVGARAEQQGHHPLIITQWGLVTVQWWTHTVGGLHQNDFIMAAKTDELARTTP